MNNIFSTAKELIQQSQNIVIMQADNPDSDSLGAALALEAVLDNLGKNVALFCAVDIPNYIKIFDGWSRVSNEIPSEIDLAIIVDCSTSALFEKAIESKQFQNILSKPVIIFDHHATSEQDIEGLNIVNSSASSACEVVYEFTKDSYHDLPKDALLPIMSGILGDTQGLTNQLATARTYEIMADLIKDGADRPELEKRRRELSKMHPSIYKYKAKLIERTQFALDGQIAFLTIPQSEIIEYSPLYNPGPLIQPDMLMTEGVRVGIVFKSYDDGKITGMIRCNQDAGIAGKIANALGGGGHDFAAGFKITDGRSIEDIENYTIEYTVKYLEELK